MATSSILHWVTRRSRSLNIWRVNYITNDQGSHQSSVRSRWMKQEHSGEWRSTQRSRCQHLLDQPVPAQWHSQQALILLPMVRCSWWDHRRYSLDLIPGIIALTSLFYNSLWGALENNSVCFVHRGILNTHGYTIKKAVTVIFASTAWWLKNVVFCTAHQAMLYFLKSGFQTGKNTREAPEEQLPLWCCSAQTLKMSGNAQQVLCTTKSWE